MLQGNCQGQMYCIYRHKHSIDLAWDLLKESLLWVCNSCMSLQKRTGLPFHLNWIANGSLTFIFQLKKAFLVQYSNACTSSSVFISPAIFKTGSCFLSFFEGKTYFFSSEFIFQNELSMHLWQLEVYHCHLLSSFFYDHTIT